MIKVWNRKEGKVEIEKVYGDFALKLAYETIVGQKIANSVLTKPKLSEIYGKYQSSRLSQRKIQPFVQEFQIPMDEFEDGPFESFNEFFIRKFKPGARSFVDGPHDMAAFAEARYFAYEKITPEQTVPVKGKFLSAEGLLGDSIRAHAFEKGPMLLARLCPTDYHRFHFPDAGKLVERYRVAGDLHSVNPLALKYKQDILIANERQVSILETQNFGRLAYIEVGALCVGKIVQTYSPTRVFQRGDEKGYFLFGGSTVIVLGEPNAWKPDADLLEQTQHGRETLVRLGDGVAVKC